MHAVPPSSFGEVLKYFRRAAGLSQEELAELAHLSRDTISTLERGISHAPRHETLTLLVNALGLTQADGARLEAAARQRFVFPPVFQHGTEFAIPLTPLLGREREVSA